MLTHLYFDFFGTLVSYSASRTLQGFPGSHRILREAGCRLDYDSFLLLWDRVADEFETAALDSLREFSMEALGGAFLERALGAAPDAPLVRRFVDHYIAEWNTGVREIPGLDAMLERLAGRYRLGVVTNTHDAALVPGHLRRLGIDRFFEVVVTSVEYGRRKPHPAIFHDALERLDARPEHSAYIGDSFDADYRGARAAGLAPYLIDPTGSQPVSEAERLGHVLELSGRLELA